MKEEVRRELIAFLPRLRRFTRALTGSRDDGDELLQATCERAIRHIDKWEAGTRLDSWMFKIARNLHLNTIRSRGIRGEHLVPVEVDRETASPHDGRAVVEARLTYASVRRLVSRLPVREPGRVGGLVAPDAGAGAQREGGAPVGVQGDALHRHDERVGERREQQA